MNVTPLVKVRSICSAKNESKDPHYYSVPTVYPSQLCTSICIIQEKKEFEQAASYLERASAMYHESGHGDTAGQVLTKAAK